MTLRPTFLAPLTDIEQSLVNILEEALTATEKWCLVNPAPAPYYGFAMCDVHLHTFDGIFRKMEANTSLYGILRKSSNGVRPHYRLTGSICDSADRDYQENALNVYVQVLRDRGISCDPVRSITD